MAVTAAVCLAPAGRTAAQAAGGEDPKVAAARYYDLLLDQYMHSQWAEFEKAVKQSSTHQRHLTAEQRGDLAYMRKTYAEFRPSWWKYTKASKNTTFTAQIWGKSFKANYMPSEFLGFQVPVGIDERTGRFQILVTWQPHLVNSTKLLDDEGAKPHRLTEGDLAEAIVWHELGHNYVTQSFPASQVMALYDNYSLLFSALQEYYADMTALYHCTPQGRKATLTLRVPDLRWNDVNDSHVRGAHAIGSWILATVLSDLSQWPSFHLPTKVADKEIERETILYMYQHIDPQYSLAEDRALREMIGKFMRTHGASVLRKKGTLSLPSGLEFKIMTAEDRQNQAQRDAWVKTQLEKAIASGQVTKYAATKGHPKRFRIRTSW